MYRCHESRIELLQKINERIRDSNLARGHDVRRIGMQSRICGILFPTFYVTIKMKLLKNEGTVFFTNGKYDY